jgi:hypothetical protein
MQIVKAKHLARVPSWRESVTYAWMGSRKLGVWDFAGFVVGGFVTAIVGGTMSVAVVGTGLVSGGAVWTFRFLIHLWKAPAEIAIADRAPLESAYAIACEDRERLQLQVPAEPKALPPIETLHDLFMREFPHVLRCGFPVVLSFASGTKLTVSAVVFQHHSSNAMFIGYYVPAFDNTFEACRGLAEQCAPVLQRAAGTVQTSLSGVGHDEAMHSTELVFTGRVAIYHETAMTLIERGKLSEIYRSQGLFPQFFSHERVAAVALISQQK